MPLWMQAVAALSVCTILSALIVIYTEPTEPQ